MLATVQGLSVSIILVCAWANIILMFPKAFLKINIRVLEVIVYNLIVYFLHN